MYLALVFHFHQPIYRSPESREYLLPWVNYHTVKNYHQMAKLVAESEFPCTFNFVPCLLEQIEEYSKGKAKDPYQEALEVEPSRLTPPQVKLLQKFLPDENCSSELQLKSLISFFSPIEEIHLEKGYLLNLQKEIQKNLISNYRKLREKGLIEITTSPYYHPLLPLVFDLSSASGEPLPALPFRHPEDGEAQIEKGREYFKKIFGEYPVGFWPSEGGISQEVAHSIARKGFSYALTDENILWKSFKEPHHSKDLLEPYQCSNLSVFFRDCELSNLLSFEYQKWKEKEAVADFLWKLEDRKKRCEDNSVCVVVLDGENPWAYYKQNGVPFLRELFAALQKKEGIQPVLLQDYLAQHKPKKELNLVPGTWMGSFSKWIGNPAKNEAWDTLSRARELCGAREEIYVVEGSDWFWWYGEKNTEEFDLLFKSYIQKAYKSAGIKMRDSG
jgi:alpha-amylase/alpha-mannosidase (GH57 family)